jgi:hypothetical protein
MVSRKLQAGKVGLIQQITILWANSKAIFFFVDSFTGLPVATVQCPVAGSWMYDEL